MIISANGNPKPGFFTFMIARSIIVRSCVRLMATILALGLPGAVLAQNGQQPAPLGEDPLSVIMRWKPTTTAPDMPDFVKKTRPAEEGLSYTPLTAEEPKRPKKMTPAELATTTSKLDAAAATARARAAAAFPVRKARRAVQGD